MKHLVHSTLTYSHSVARPHSQVSIATCWLAACQIPPPVQCASAEADSILWLQRVLAWHPQSAASVWLLPACAVRLLLASHCQRPADKWLRLAIQLGLYTVFSKAWYQSSIRSQQLPFSCSTSCLCKPPSKTCGHMPPISSKLNCLMCNGH